QVVGGQGGVVTPRVDVDLAARVVDEVAALLEEAADRRQEDGADRGAGRRELPHHLLRADQGGRYQQVRGRGAPVLERPEQQAAAGCAGWRLLRPKEGPNRRQEVPRGGANRGRGLPRGRPTAATRKQDRPPPHRTWRTRTGEGIPSPALMPNRRAEGMRGN